MIHRCSTLRLNAAWSLQNSGSVPGCWWLIFSAEVLHWGTKPRSSCSLTWWNCCNKERWREGAGSLHSVGRRFGSIGVRCDVAQVAVYFPRHGRTGAPRHGYRGCKRLCSVARGGKLWWAPTWFLAQLSWVVLWSLVPGTRGTCQDVVLLGT